jgi:hypothetical protein
MGQPERLSSPLAPILQQVFSAQGGGRNGMLPICGIYQTALAELYPAAGRRTPDQRRPHGTYESPEAQSGSLTRLSKLDLARACGEQRATEPYIAAPRCFAMVCVVRFSRAPYRSISFGIVVRTASKSSGISTVSFQ